MRLPSRVSATGGNSPGFKLLSMVSRRALLAMKLPYLRATFWAATVGKVLAVAGALLMAFWFHNYLGAALFVFIFMAGEAEYRAVRRRDLEDAYWREMMLRAYAVPPSPEPPILTG